LFRSFWFGRHAGLVFGADGSDQRAAPGERKAIRSVEDQHELANIAGGSSISVSRTNRIAAQPAIPVAQNIT
jgi:hypothetical protein